ncbi:hypothetical protein BH10BAC5_BH10BAC5_09570 [soil metagenome]
MFDHLKLVYTTLDDFQAGIIKAKLEDENIEFSTEGGSSRPYKASLQIPIKIYVAEKDYELALTAINTDNSAMMKDELDY